MVKVLENHAKNNESYRRRLKDKQDQLNRTLGSIYGTWMLEQLGENLEQVGHGRVLSFRLVMDNCGI